MTNFFPWARAGLIVLLVVFGGRILYLKAELEQVRAAHEAACQARDQWKAAAAAYEHEAKAQAENARMCIDRESRAARNAAERTAVMAKVKPRPRDPSEKKEVIDDETRHRAVLRLNRPL